MSELQRISTVSMNILDEAVLKIAKKGMNKKILVDDIIKKIDLRTIKKQYKDWEA